MTNIWFESKCEDREGREVGRQGGEGGVKKMIDTCWSPEVKLGTTTTLVTESYKKHNVGRI